MGSLILLEESIVSELARNGFPLLALSLPEVSHLSKETWHLRHEFTAVMVTPLVFYVLCFNKNPFRVAGKGFGGGIFILDGE